MNCNSGTFRLTDDRLEASICCGEHGLARFSDDFVDHAAAAVKGPIICVAKSEIRCAFDVLVHRTIGELSHCRPYGWRDHLIAVRYMGIESAAAIELRAVTGINDRTEGWRGGHYRAFRRWNYHVLPSLHAVIDAVSVPVRRSCDGDCCGRSRQ